MVKIIKKSLFAPTSFPKNIPDIKGIKLASMNCGFKKKNNDLLLVIFDKNTSVAGVFSQNSILAAPTIWCKNIIKNGQARALVINSGNANSFTGKAGEKIVAETTKKAAKLLKCNNEEVYISSTGVIGKIFPHQQITDQIPALFKECLSKKNISSDDWLSACQSIMTTDTFEKIIFKKTLISGKEVNIIGIAKGGGMIEPNMATMLGFIFTDANLDSKILNSILKSNVEASFNSISVDTDCSTNDMVLLFATAKSDHKKIDNIDDEDLKQFKTDMSDLMINLAKTVVMDGEGITKLIEVEVKDANDYLQAKSIGKAIINSPLVKAAIFGQDANWGRIIMAIGKTGVKVNFDKFKLIIGDELVAEGSSIKNGYNEEKLTEYMKKNNEIKIKVNLGLGNFSAKVWGCDLSYDYVKINADYRS